MKIAVDEKNLEKALSSAGKSEEESADSKKKCKCEDNDKDCECNNNEEISFHKGCLNTLVGERNELIKMIQNVEAIMQAHIKRLTELGVKLQSEKK